MYNRRGYGRGRIVFRKWLKGTAEKRLLKSLETTNEIYGLEMFAMVSAVVPLGEQLRGK